MPRVARVRRCAMALLLAAAADQAANANGRQAYGGITGPGNAPWVLAVGASIHMGTANRGDDTMAAFSSRGPIGRLASHANAWSTDLMWSAPTTPSGQNVEWGALWRATRMRNVVWGAACGGDDCDRPWSIDGANADDSVVWGTSDADSVVWGTSDDDNVVWGTDCGDPACEPVIWPAPSGVEGPQP
jgi:hypothetical protein